MRPRLLCIALALLAAGCSADRFAQTIAEAAGAFPDKEAPRFIPIAPLPADRAVLYIYRPYVKFNFAGYPEISVAGMAKFALKTRGYRPFTLAPGDYEIKAECGSRWFPASASRRLSVQAGAEYYVRVTPGPAVAGDEALEVKSRRSRFPTACSIGQTYLTLVAPARALAEISGMQLLADEEVRSIESR